MRRLTQLTLAAIVMTAITGCATMRVSSHVARGLSYEAGTLVIDVLDARTNRLLGRGWAQKSVNGMLENQDTMARQIDEAVTRMFERFPRPL